MCYSAPPVKIWGEYKAYLFHDTRTLATGPLIPDCMFTTSVSYHRSGFGLIRNDTVIALQRRIESSIRGRLSPNSIRQGGRQDKHFP